MQRARWKYLLHRSYEQTASPEEQAELMAALREGGPDEAILDELIARHRTDVALPGTRQMRFIIRSWRSCQPRNR